MTTPSDVYGSLVDNGLDFLGDRVIHTDGHERLEYWKKFNVRSLAKTLFLCRAPSLTVSVVFAVCRRI